MTSRYKIKSLKSHLKRESTIAGIGIALEYYSVFLFGYLSFIILPHFFQKSISYTVSLILILEAVMGVIGAIICGHVGDTLGRKKILAYTIACVAFPSFAISILPSYDQIGIIASIIFIALRLTQVLAFGGDMIGLVTFILEDVPPNQRGKFGGYMSMSAGIGTCIASLFLYFADPFSNPTSFWKWRFLLIFGITGMFVANYLKNMFGESEFFMHYKKIRHNAVPPIIDVIKNNKLTVLRVMGITILAPIITLTIYGWLSQFSVKHFELSARHAMLFNFGALVLFAIGACLFGKWSDRFGRRRILIGVSAFFLFFSYPLFKYLTQTETIVQLFLIQAIFAFASSAYYGAAMTACIEHVPTHIRYTGVAVGYYINYALFGGISGDYIEKFLIGRQYPESSPVFYLMTGALIVLACSYFLKEKAGRVLSDKSTVNHKTT